MPIVKFEDAETGYNFDVSFDVANGPEVRRRLLVHVWVGVWAEERLAGTAVGAVKSTQR